MRNLLCSQNIFFIMTVLRMVTICFLFGNVYAKDEPHFLGPETNVTVVVGRDATLTCQVENLQSYKVAWLRVDTQTILTIGPHVITKNHRVSVARAGAAWTLSVRGARAADGGRYMCQINTEPMRTQTHLLQVVVPPDIVDSDSSGEIMVREGDNVSLHCAASGTPTPSVTWRREDSGVLRVEDRAVTKWSGVWLNMTQVARDLNGAYLCIATNGVPPSVSKRILLYVLCAPSALAAHKVIGGYIGGSASLECRIEANPTPTVYWTHIDTARLQNSTKYQASIKSEGYKHTAILKVSNVTRDDIGSYQCNVENALGKASVDITLYTLATTTTSTTSSSTSVIETDVTIASSVELEETERVLEETERELEGTEGELSEDHQIVVVLSQHQMQNFDLAASS